jgi:hypothetical protein
MVESKPDTADELLTGCPQLGHPVPFTYCTECSDCYPCRKIIECWSHRVDVPGYLTTHYTDEEIAAKILSPPKPKLLQLLELAQKAAIRRS